MRALAAAFAAAALAAGSAALGADEPDAATGKALFERAWVPAPLMAGGLGPLFAARSCAGCHVGEALAGRFTAAPEGRIAGRGLVMRFGDPAGRPDPLYGRQLQTQAVPGLASEGRMVLTASDDAARGYEAALSLAHGALHPATRRSLRIAPPLVGRALLETIDAAAVLALADPDNGDGDGISGRARMVETESGEALGRYGWKASTARLTEQVADAFALDLGLSSRFRPHPHGDCTELQRDCVGAPSGASERQGDRGLSDEMIDAVAAYVASLDMGSRPAERSRGADIFAEVGCAECHVPSLPTDGGRRVAAYTDLLLHDMGAALDDSVGEPGVASSEWRTAPLIAMRQGDGRRYMHDGRAATIDGAIRAHGGEAAAARTRYVALDEEERAVLVTFVESL